MTRIITFLLIAGTSAAVHAAAASDTHNPLTRWSIRASQAMRITR